MLFFETTLKRDELEERFFSRVEIHNMNARRFIPRGFMKEVPRGNIQNDMVWLDYRTCPNDTNVLLPAFYEFNGKIKETETGTVVFGTFARHFLETCFLCVFLLVFILAAIKMLFSATTVWDYMIELWAILFPVGFATFLRRQSKKNYALQEKNMIQFMEILWNATCRKE